MHVRWTPVVFFFIYSTSNIWTIVSLFCVSFCILPLPLPPRKRMLNYMEPCIHSFIMLSIWRILHLFQIKMMISHIENERNKKILKMLTIKRFSKRIVLYSILKWILLWESFVIPKEKAVSVSNCFCVAFYSLM